jgi:hypothetical protein
MFFLMNLDELNNDASWHGRINSLAQFAANRKINSQRVSNNVPSINFSKTQNDDKREKEFEEKRRQILANEARLARIQAQEQRKIQIKTDQEIEKRGRDKLKNIDEKMKMLQTKPTEETKTSSIKNEAAIKFKNVVLKDEKPKQKFIKISKHQNNVEEGKQMFLGEQSKNEQKQSYNNQKQMKGQIKTKIQTTPTTATTINITTISPTQVRNLFKKIL